MNYDTIPQEELDGLSSTELLHHIELKTARYIPERFVHALKASIIREASVGTVSVKAESRNCYPYVDKLTMKEGMSHGWMEYDLIPKTEETVTERQERILKDKRNYSFRRFMFGRMNMDKKRKETP